MRCAGEDLLRITPQVGPTWCERRRSCCISRLLGRAKMDDLDEYADEDPPLSDSGDEDYTAVIQREEAAAAAATSPC